MTGWNNIAIRFHRHLQLAGERHGEPTFGGYSEQHRRRPKLRAAHARKHRPEGRAPLLCAGITTYSPLRHWKVGPGQKVGIIGLGGLGHMGVKLANAMGAHVVMITTSPEKVKDAQRLGADEVWSPATMPAMAKARGSFHFLLNTVAAAMT